MSRIDGIYYCENLNSNDTHIIKRMRKKYYCPVCGIEKNRDDRICINCYNKQRHNISNCPSKDVLYNTLSQTPNFTKVAAMFGVTDNAVRKWCKYYGLPYKTSEWKERQL